MSNEATGTGAGTGTDRCMCRYRCRCRYKCRYRCRYTTSSNLLWLKNSPIAEVGLKKRDPSEQRQSQFRVLPVTVRQCREREKEGRDETIVLWEHKWDLPLLADVLYVCLCLWEIHMSGCLYESWPTCCSSRCRLAASTVFMAGLLTSEKEERKNRAACH